jgi:hypothetical protein
MLRKLMIDAGWKNQGNDQGNVIRTMSSVSGAMKAKALH